MTALYWAAGPPCTCATVDDDCAGCAHARYTAFLRGWSWIAVAVQHARKGGRR